MSTSSDEARAARNAARASAEKTRQAAKLQRGRDKIAKVYGDRYTKSGKFIKGGSSGSQEQEVVQTDQPQAVPVKEQPRQLEATRTPERPIQGTKLTAQQMVELEKEGRITSKPSLAQQGRGNLKQTPDAEMQPATEEEKKVIKAQPRKEDTAALRGGLTFAPVKDYFADRSQRFF